MPQLQNVIVCVTDGDGKGLEEWGVQYLRGNKVSAYIKSTPNMAFGISIRPRIPYPEEQPPDEGGRRGIKKEVLSDVKNKREDLDGDINMLPPYSAQRAPAHRDFPCTRKPSRNDSFYRASSPIHKRKKTLQENIPPFSLLATLYLDGRIKSERALIVHLDPNDDDFSHPNGEATFRCRRVQGGNGFVNEQAWLFKEIGIETVFEKIVLRDPTDDLQDPEDVLVNALKDSGLGGERSQVKEERAKVGQIVIELKRVLLGKKFNNRDYRPMHSEGDKDDVEMDGASQGVAHTTAFKHLSTLEPGPVRCIEHRPYVEGEGPWATFRFFYRSQEQLQKFNFLGFPRDLEIEKKRLRDARRLGTRLAMTTPLSIAHPLPPALKSGKRSKPTFEERVKEGSAELVDSEHKYEFKDYRDVDKSGKISSIVKSSKNPDNLQASHPAARGTSMVVAVKGKTRRLSKAKSSTRAGRFSSRSPSSNESTDNYPNSPHGSSIQPPANSPTTGFYDPIRDPRLSAPRGSQLDTFKTLCDTSLALIKATEPAGESQFESSSAVKDTKYRQLQYDSDSNDAGDEQSDAIEDEDDGDSDKENMQMTDADNAGLHNELKAISLGTKRQRGEGMEELEEGEVSETEEVQMKKKIPAADHAITGSVALERVIEEGKKKAALRAENGEEDAHFEKTLALWKEQEEQVGWGDLDDFL